MPTLSLTNLHARIETKQVLQGVDLTINTGELHAIMGPNGSGKSTTAGALMGRPLIKVTAGSATITGKDLLALSPTDRAREGLFLGFQYPMDIAGVSAAQMLRIADKAQRHHRGRPQRDAKTFQEELRVAATALGVSNELLRRSLNEGFSGGEKKRMEMLQCWILEPLFIILDEIDSGLDVDALKMIAGGIQLMRERFNPGIVLITHYQRILEFVKPDIVHIFVDGRVAQTGGPELAHHVEQNGYAQYSNTPTPA